MQVTPLCWASPTTYAGQPIPDSPAARDAAYVHALVHRCERWQRRGWVVSGLRMHMAGFSADLGDLGDLADLADPGAPDATWQVHAPKPPACLPGISHTCDMHG